MPLLLELLFWFWKFSCVKIANNELAQVLLSSSLKAAWSIAAEFFQLVCLIKLSFLFKYFLPE